MMKRREYLLRLTINGHKIRKVIIDPHYEKKHSDSMNDEIILSLVRQLDENFFEPDSVTAPYRYFVTDKMLHEGKRYKLVWLLEDDELYIGIVNAYRRK